MYSQDIRNNFQFQFFLPPVGSYTGNHYRSVFQRQYGTTVKNIAQVIKEGKDPKFWSDSHYGCSLGSCSLSASTLHPQTEGNSSHFLIGLSEA